jgi:thiol:disulfide interchange protein DsbD
LLLLTLTTAASAQMPGPHVVSVEPLPALKARRGAEVEVPLRLVIRGGYHINSNEPAEDYLIPTALTWVEGPFTPRGVTYPKAESVKYEFSSKPLLVYSGAITLRSRLLVAGSASPGATTLTGKFRYQACNDKACLPPRTLDVSVPITIE